MVDTALELNVRLGYAVGTPLVAFLDRLPSEHKWAWRFILIATAFLTLVLIVLPYSLALRYALAQAGIVR